MTDRIVDLRRKGDLAVEIDGNELMLRMAEAFVGVRRSPDISLDEAIEHIASNPTGREILNRMARSSKVALAYIEECLSKGQPLN